MGFFPNFALEAEGHHCLNTMFMINTRGGVSPWFLLGVLNSSATRVFWLDRFWDRRRTFPKIKGTYSKALPLPGYGDSQVEELAQLMTKYWSSHATATDASRRAHLERAMEATQHSLDVRVLELFGLGGDHAAALNDFVDATVPKGTRR